VAAAAEVGGLTMTDYTIPTREQAIAILSSHATNAVGALSEQNAKLKSMADEYHALDMAIDALMQQSEPTEPCYYCRDLDGVNCYQRGTLYRKGEEINSVPARYCMNCGRRIKP
jgi:hypothetical protein